jgi:hypothetical protein
MGADIGTGALGPPSRIATLGRPAPAPMPHAPDLVGGPPRRVVLPRWMVLIVLIAAQVAFARAMIQAPELGVVQLFAVTGIALWAALKRAATVSLCLIAYIPAMEICQRQNHTPIPYLAAPYLLILISVLATFTIFNNLTKPGRTALLYVALLIPSSIVTISMTGNYAREPIVFALAGPTSLAMLIVFLSQVHLEHWMYRRVLWVFLISGMAPIAVAATSISEYVAVAGAINFNDESNFAASGGFGPVQVSSVMGLSVVVAVLAVMVEREIAPRLLAGALGIGAATMSFLTFSRGGMTAAGLAVGALVIANPGSRVARRKVIAIVGIALVVGYLVLIPWLNAFTRGGFEQRFSDTETSRTELAKSDLDIFLDHPAFGVGPGMSKYQRLTWEICQIRADRCKDEGSSHTEFTRMLSEHGVSGIVAAVILATLPIQAYRRAGPSRAVTITFLVWAVAQMFYANFRVSAVAVAFAFAFVQVDMVPRARDGSPLVPEPEVTAPLRAPVTRRDRPGGPQAPASVR